MSDWPCLSAGGAAHEARLDVTVVPNAKRTGSDGLHDGALRVRLLAPPVDGKANEALIAWLARELGLPKRDVALLRGQTSRRKQLTVAAPVTLVADWLSQQAAHWS